MKPVVIVGAGIAGLVAAVELARRGVPVTVVEKAEGPGGKMRQHHVAGVAIDAGPTVFTMRWVFDEIFASAGASLDQHLTLSPLDILARHAWPDGAQLDLHATPACAADAVGVFAGAAEARGYLAFCDEARRIYNVLRGPFLEGTRPNPISLTRRIGLNRLDDLFAIRPFETMWRALGRHFADPRLRQLFGRYATYSGSSPFQAPATLMLIAHVEQEGVWSIEGGMHRLASALESLAVMHGARFRYGARVDAVNVESGHTAGVTLATGERLGAQAVVMNADPAAIATGTFGHDIRRVASAPPRAARSLSAVTWSLAAKVRGFPLRRHTVFFSGDSRREFEDLFTRRRRPADPTIYVCAQDRDHGAQHDAGHERLLVLINAPADGDQTAMTAQERYACRTAVFTRLQRQGLIIDAEPTHAVMTTPRDFETLFPNTGGALYGRATHGWAAAFQRPGARTRIPGLYLAGGGAHPGAGVPMAALSGRTAARRLLADSPSLRTLHPVAMPGGMSTPSATTADTA